MTLTESDLSLILIVVIAGSASIFILSEVVKRMFRFRSSIPAKYLEEHTQLSSRSTDSRRNFKISLGDKSYVVTVEELQETATLKPEATSPPQVTEPMVTVSEDEDRRVVKAPLPGVVLSIKCEVGENIAVGSVLLTLEAMKMENEIIAPVAGVIKSIKAKEGQTVELGEVLVELSD